MLLGYDFRAILSVFKDGAVGEVEMLCKLLCKLLARHKAKHISRAVPFKRIAEILLHVAFEADNLNVAVCVRHGFLGTYVELMPMQMLQVIHVGIGAVLPTMNAGDSQVDDDVNSTHKLRNLE
jgi:hypothetical protein